MSQILCSWIGGTDWEVFDGKSKKDELGPILRTLEDEDWRDVDEIHLLNNYKNREAADFKKFLSKKTKAKIVGKDVKIASPTNFKGIDEAAGALVRGLPEDARLIYLVSPGTYVMSSVWILLAHNQFPATLIEASKEAGVQNSTYPSISQSATLLIVQIGLAHRSVRAEGFTDLTLKRYSMTVRRCARPLIKPPDLQSGISRY